MARAEPQRTRYRIFGLTLSTETGLAGRLVRAAPGAQADLWVDWRRSRPSDQLPEPVYTSLLRTETGEAALTVHRTGDGVAMRFPEGIEFHLEHERITVYRPGGDDRHDAESLLLGPVLGLWLELRGLLVLHASSVATARGAVGFLAAPRAGKSSLAAEFVAAGRPLLGDDLLVAEARDGRWQARPAFPQLRLWPDACRRLDAGWRSFERVHPGHEKRRVPVGDGGVGRWLDRCEPLAALYLPERRDGLDDPRIEGVAARDAWLELVRHSFVARAVEALGLQPERFGRLGDLAAAVPLRRLLLPPGLERLGEARRRVEADLEALASELGSTESEARA